LFVAAVWKSLGGFFWKICFSLFFFYFVEVVEEPLGVPLHPHYLVTVVGWTIGWGVFFFRKVSCPPFYLIDG